MTKIKQTIKNQGNSSQNFKNRLIFTVLDDYFHIIYLIVNTCPNCKNTGLISVVQSHFKGEMNLAGGGAREVGRNSAPFLCFE